jgi:predicted branched-subunit amino acid permease
LLENNLLYIECWAATGAIKLGDASVDKSLTAIATLIIIVGLLFLPLLVTFVKRRGTLQLLTFLLCIAAIAVQVLGFFGGIFGGILATILAAQTWAAALICGAAAAIDNMAEARMRENRKRANARMKELSSGHEPAL